VPGLSCSKPGEGSALLDFAGRTERKLDRAWRLRVPPHSLTDLAGLGVSAEDFLAAVSETAAQPIWVVDPDDVIRFANPAAITALGYDSADELLGRHRHETIHYKHPDGTPYPAAQCPMRLPRTMGQTVARDLDWFFRRDGSKLPVSYVSVPVGTEGRGAVVVFADIGDRLRAEEVLRERDAVLGAREDSLRRIAALVADGAASADVFAAIAREVGGVVGLPLVVVWRYAPDRTAATVIGAWSEGPHPFQTGTRWLLEGPSVLTQVLKTGRPARIDDFSELPGMIADVARKTGLRAAAGAPIIVNGDLWGAMSGNAVRAPLPDHMEDRLAAFTELVATAIANTESRADLARMAEEQAALRRMATLVAHGAAPEDVFAAVTEEIGQLPGVDFAYMARYEPDRTVTAVAAWGRISPVFPVGGQLALEGRNLSTLVFETGRPARIDSYRDASGPAGVTGRESGYRSSVGSPIVVERRLWGIVMVASTLEQPLPADTEARLASFATLLTTAIANAESRAGLGRLAEEQAALRRVATLVARGTRPQEVFAAVANEVGRLLSVDVANVVRYESDDMVTLVASAGERIPVGSRWPLWGTTLAPIVLETGRPARVDNYAQVTGPLADDLREERIRSAVATPIIVEGRVWGQMVTASSQKEPLPPDTEARLASFTDLVAMAIANTEARTEVAASRARIVAAADEERRRVVRDLHDGAQQRLVHTILMVAQARQALQPHQEPASKFMAEALAQAEAATEELRALAHGLLPEILTHRGLRAAVKSLASRTPVPVDVAVSVGRLAAAVEATAYFVIAEALTNVAKHAHARHVTVTARVEDGTLQVRVRDDGVGGALPEGSGLLGLSDRLAVLDGQLRVESPIDGGTLVAADIPLSG
jgi:PAS domain S-box-containing protein